ncbi:MAG TPA: ATP-binding protein [Pyrinomonadaceae bacterium]|jgi:serine/threonine-protein kinase RsbW|nr:ATP-binding protein [Pyrinomonadaceae bacterium]
MQRNILIIDDHDDLATALAEVFAAAGHQVKVLEKRADAVAMGHLDEFDLVISDLDVRPETASETDTECLPEIPLTHETNVKAFKLCAANYRRDGFDEEELKEFVATILDYKIRFVDKVEFVKGLHENIQFELPSAMSLMHIVLEYLIKRVEKLGVCKPEQTNLFVALDEAFVNAIKHGNKYDPTKLIRVNADVSPEEARFTIEDEGEGFDVNNIPDPLDPENLFKTSGRGVLFIYNIMDEVQYNDRGNRLTMVKKAPVEKCEPA